MAARTKLFENNVILVGNIGADPQEYHTQNGNTVIRLSLATHYRKRSNNNVFTDISTWHRIVMFNPSDHVLSYLKKGNKVRIEGYLHNGSYDKNGAVQYYTEVVGQNVTPIVVKSSVVETESSNDRPNEEYTNQEAINDILNSSDKSDSNLPF